MRSRSRASRTGRRLLYGMAALLLLAPAIAVQDWLIRLPLPDFDPSSHLRFMAAIADLPPLGQPLTQQRQIKNSGDYNVAVAFNAHGLRDHRDVAQAGPDDWLVVGDSFVFGWGVEEKQRFADVAEAQLHGPRLFNLGIPTDLVGYDKLLGYAHALGAQSRNVVIAVNMTDDLAAYAAPNSQQQGAVARPNIAYVPPTLNLGTIKEALLTNSALYFATTKVIHTVPLLHNLAVKGGLIVARDQNLTGIADTEAVEKSADVLAAIAAHNRRTIVMVISNRFLWSGRQHEKIATIHQSFVQALRQRGLDVLDLRPAWEGSGNPLSLHFRNDGHWTPMGHALAGGLLAQAIGQGGR